MVVGEKYFSKDELEHYALLIPYIARHIYWYLSADSGLECILLVYSHRIKYFNTSSKKRCNPIKWHKCKGDRSPAGTERSLNQFWTNVIRSGLNQSWTNPEPIWPDVLMYPSVQISVQVIRSWIKNACRECNKQTYPLLNKSKDSEVN